MTVQELITALQSMPAEAEVVVGEGIELDSVFYDDACGNVVIVEA